MLCVSDLALAFRDGLLGLDLQRVLDQLDLPVEAGFMLLALAQEVGPEVGLLLPLADAAAGCKCGCRGRRGPAAS